MAYRLGEHVVYGHLDNRRENRIRGSLHLWGDFSPDVDDIHFELTGNCAPDLRGRYIRFWCRCDPWKCKPVDAETLKGFERNQTGEAGKMSASGWVRSLPCSVEEYLQRKRLGEPPPTPWVRHLYLEWYGPNGRVVVEMADPLVEQRPDTDEVDGRKLAPHEIWVPLPNLAMMPDAALRDAPPSGIGITEISLDGDNHHIKHWSKVTARDDMKLEPLDPLADEEDCDDEAWDEETEYVCDCCGEPQESLLERVHGEDPFPPADSLDDVTIRSELRRLVKRLEALDISYEVCEHCNAREAYRILLEEILPQNDGNPEPDNMEGVDYFSTVDYCPECIEDRERPYDKYLDGEYDIPEEDIPF